MTNISENPTSNTGIPPFQCLAVESSGIAVRLIPDFALYRLPGLTQLFCRLVIGAHAFLEAFDGSAQIAPHVTQLLGPENQHDHQQHDQPMPNTE